MDHSNQPFIRDADVTWEPAGAGVVRKILTYNDEIMMVRVTFEAGAAGPAHSHPHLQCSLIESGVWDVTIAGRKERLRAGDSFLVPSNAVHDAVAIEAGTLVDVFTPMREDFV
jgi:quercetin dioxygenase-like cupin family protein